MLTRRAFLIGAVSTTAVAAASASSAETTPELAGAFAKIDRFFEVYDEIRKAVDSDEHRVIWVTGQSRSGKTAMAQMLLNDIGRFGSSALHLPTQDAKREFLRSHNEGDWLVYSVTGGILDLWRERYQFVVIDDVEEHDNAEGHVVLAAAKRSLIWSSGRIIAFGTSVPPKPLRCRHIVLPDFA